MRGIPVIASILGAVGLVVLAATPQRTPGGMRLLPGYSLSAQQGVDADIWDIVATGERRLRLEVGPKAGSWADPAKKKDYAWYREAVVHGHHARLALTRPGIKSWLDSYFPPGEESAGLLLVTFQLNEGNWMATANCAARAGTPEALADALIMALSFDPAALR